jgi:hypothetical protein
MTVIDLGLNIEEFHESLTATGHLKISPLR